MGPKWTHHTSQVKLQSSFPKLQGASEYPVSTLWVHPESCGYEMITSTLVLPRLSHNLAGICIGSVINCIKWAGPGWIKHGDYWGITARIQGLNFTEAPYTTIKLSKLLCTFLAQIFPHKHPMFPMRKVGTFCSWTYKKIAWNFHGKCLLPVGPPKQINIFTFNMKK